MAFDELVVFVLVLEQGSVERKVARARVGLDLFNNLVKVYRLLGTESCAAGDVTERVFGTDSRGVKRFVKAFSELRHKRQRSAEIYDLTLNLTSLSETRDGLADYGTENTLSDVRLSGTLIEKRLDIGFCKNAAARGDCVGFFVFLGELVELLKRNVEKHRHLVDKRARSARAGSVHTNLESAREEKDFCVLAAQLDYNVGAGDKGICRDSCGVNLLHKVDSAILGYAHSRAATHGNVGVLRTGDSLADRLEDFADFLGNLGVVALVGAVYYFVLIIKNYAFNRSRADIKS